MNKKLVFGMGALILLAGFVGFQINDQEKIHPDLISNPDKIVIDSLLDGRTPGKEYQQYLIYENCTIEANQKYRIDREDYNVYDEENKTLCLIKEIISVEQFKKLNGSVKNDQKIKDNWEEYTSLKENGEVNPKIISVSDCPVEFIYLYTEYEDYQSLASIKLEEILNIGKFEDGIYYSDRNNYFGPYGGKEGIENKKECGKIYFLMYKNGEWDSVRYWAVEMDAENGKMLKWEEVTLGDNEIDYPKLWWIN